MNIKQGVKMHNRFDVEVRDAITGEVKKKAEGYNIILDQMYTRLCGGNSYFLNIHFGTGTGTLSPTRTSLFTHLGTKTAETVETVKALPTTTWKRKITLNPEEYVGSEITEVGIAYGSTSSYLVTHAMLEDSEGNPISIVKTDTDIIIIYATVFITLLSTYATLYYYPASINSLITYLTGGSAPTGSFGLKPVLAGERLGSTSNVTWASDVANKQRKTNVARFAATVANGHARVLDFTNLFQLKLPAEYIFSGQPYADVSIGTGDGVQDTFAIPSYNIKIDTLQVKINGLLTDAYQLESSPVEFGHILESCPARGAHTALSDDGTVMALGSNTVSPYVRVWDWDGAFWVWVPRPLPGSVPKNGHTVSLNADGTTLALAAYSASPAVKVWDWDGSAWTARPQPANLPSYGYDVSLNAAGNVLAMATYTASPYVKVWDWDGSAWTERPNPLGTASIGVSVSLNADGTVLAFGSQSTYPLLRVWDWDGSAWIARPQPVDLPESAYDISISGDGTALAIATYSVEPYIRVWDWDGSAWITRSQPPNTPTYGVGVSISKDGTTVALCSGSTAPYLTVWDWDGNSWAKRSQPANISSSVHGISLNTDGTILSFGLWDTSPYAKVFSYDTATAYSIKFNTAPNADDAITASYTVLGVHKTDQYVVDASLAIQFGEGV